MDIEFGTKEIQRFVQEGNYHAAYNIALSGLNACRKNNDQAGIDQFINIIKGVVDSLAAEFGSQQSQYLFSIGYQATYSTVKSL